MLPPIISQRLRRLLYPYDLAQHDNFSCIVRAQTGSLLEGSTNDFHFYPFSIHGYYDWRNVAVALALTNNGDVILEVGANVGTETVSYADIVGPDGVVHAFEPVPSNVSRLRRACDLSEYKNIVIHGCALSNRIGQTEFVLPPEYSSGTGHIAQEHEDNPGETIQVPVMTLDSIHEEVNRANLICIDIEGEEVAFLDGAENYLKACRPHLVLEASPVLLERASVTMNDLYERLKNLGYSMYRISRFGLCTVDPNVQSKPGNWVCLSHSQKALADRISGYILRCALLPCVRGVNPLTQR